MTSLMGFATCCLILFQSAFCCCWVAVSCRELQHIHKLCVWELISTDVCSHGLCARITFTSLCYEKALLNTFEWVYDPRQPPRAIPQWLQDSICWWVPKR